jgi:hypothetical protein
MGSMIDWLPSRRSVESQRGAFSIRRDGHWRYWQRWMGDQRVPWKIGPRKTRAGTFTSKGE